MEERNMNMTINNRAKAIPYSKYLVCINQKKMHHQTKAQLYTLVELPMHCSEVNLALGLNAWIQKEPNLQVILRTKKTRIVRPLFFNDIQDIKVLTKKERTNAYVLELNEQQQSRFIQTIMDVAN